MQLVIQLAKAKGVHTVNVVRDRPNMKELQQQLKDLGADIVTTDASLKEALGKSPNLFPVVSCISQGCHSVFACFAHAAKAAYMFTCMTVKGKAADDSRCMHTCAAIMRGTHDRFIMAFYEIVNPHMQRLIRPQPPCHYKRCKPKPPRALMQALQQIV